MRLHALGTTTAAASALVATTLLTGGAAVADNNRPPPPINGPSGADGGTPMPPLQIERSHAGGGAPATLLLDCGDRAKVKPDQYTLACGDGTNYLTDLKWTHWGTYTARGTGVQHANDCAPDCAHGTFHSYSVIVTANKRTQLAGYRGVSYFSRMRLDYGTVRPGELTHQDYTLTP